MTFENMDGTNELIIADDEVLMIGREKFKQPQYKGHVDIPEKAEIHEEMNGAWVEANVWVSFEDMDAYPDQVGS